MAKNLQVNLQLNTAQAQSALRQLQQQAGQIGRSSGGGGSTGGGGGGGGGGGLRIPGMPSMAGGVAGLAVGAVVAGIAAVSKELSDLGKRAQELAQSANNSASALGQLRSATERTSINRDLAASNPGVISFEKTKQDVSKGLTDFVAGLTGTKAQRDKATADRLAQGLGGQAGEDWRRIKEQRLDMETDISTARTAMGVKYQRQARDFAFEQKSWAIDIGNQKFDLQKEAQRQEQDYTIQKQKFDENFQGQQAAKQFAISQYYAKQAYQISQSRATQDFSISQSDKAFDFKKSIGDQNQDFAISQGRALTSRKNQLFDMAMGGANGLQYLQASRDFNQQQQYAKQDFALNQSREKRDYGIDVGRDTRNFGISVQRNAQDFSISQQQAQVGRQMELDNMAYARKYEGLELDLQHNRQVADLNTQYQRLNQSIGLQLERFGNQKSDMAYDKNLDYAEFNRKTMRQRRDQGYTEEDFANAQRQSNPIGAVGQAAQDAEFAGALSRGGQRTGQTDLIDQYNKARQDQENSFLTKAGEIVGVVVAAANKIVGGINNPNNNLFGNGPTSPSPKIWDILGGIFSWAGSQLGNISNPNNSLFGNNSSVNNTGRLGSGPGGGSYYGGFDASNFVGANGPGFQPGLGSGNDYMDGPSREQAGKQSGIFNVGGSNTYNVNVTADPQMEQKMEAIAAKYAMQAAMEMADLVKSAYS